MILGLLFIIGVYYTVKDEPEEDPVIVDNSSIYQGQQEHAKKAKPPVSNKERPAQGISTWIGKDANELEQKYGKPNRVEPSAYGYDWWIYNQDLDNYIQFGVNSNKQIATVFSSAQKMNIYPFAVGQSIDDIYKQLNMDSFVELNYQETDYRFELSEDDLHIRPLIKFDDIYAQVYLDKFEGTVSSVRFMDAATLILQRPYEVTYRGQLLEPPDLTDKEWNEVQRGSELQIIDLTNIIRNRFMLSTVKEDKKTTEVAYSHSKDMMENNYFSHVTLDEKDLGDRLEEGHVSYILAGENIAAQYTDSIAAVEGWLNSKGHRDNMLNEDFTHLGAGVYKKYYTQNFIKKNR